MVSLATVSFSVSPGCVNTRDIAHDHALTTLTSGLKLDIVLYAQSQLQTACNLTAQCRLSAVHEARDDSAQTTANAIGATVPC